MTENHKKTILLVDDEVIIAMAGASTIEKHGYTVLVAHSGEEAIKTAAGQPVPDLILMDIDLGRGMDGTQAAAIILEHLDIPVLFLSSHIEPEIVDKTEKINSYGYVVKNSGETVLLASIRMAFKLHAANLEIRKHEDDLRKSEKKLSLIFENTPNTITITDLITGIVVDANKGVEWTGWSKDEIIGKSPAMLQSWVNPDESEKIRAIIKEKGKLVDHRVSFYKKDHTIVHALMNSAIIQMDGKPYLLTTSNDITRVVKSEHEVNRAKEELEEANEELNATIEDLEATNEELQATNRELEESKNDLETLLEEHKKALKELGEKEYFLRKSQEVGRIGSFTLEFPNPGEIEYRIHNSLEMDDIFGIDADFPKTKEDWLKLLVEPDKVLDHLRNDVIAKKAIFDIEYQIRRHRDGKVRWVWGLGELIYDDRGDITGMIGTAQDITDRKHADEAISLSEERYRTIFEQSATANIITAADTTIMLANSKFAEITGYSREELEGKLSWTVLVVPEYLARMKQYSDQRRAAGGSPPQSYEFKGRIRSGEIRDFFMNVTMIPGTTESLAALIDITDRVRAEERFSELAQQLPETVFETDPRGRVTYVNEAGLKCFGYTMEEVIDKISILDVIAPGDHQRIMGNMAKIIAGQALGLNEYRAKKKDGTVFPILIHTSPIIRDEKIAGLRGFIIDITERERAEESSRLSEERYRTIFEKSATANAILSEDTKILLVNSKFENITGYTKEEMEGRMSWTSLVVPEDLDKMKTYHRERRTDPGSPPQSYEFRAKISSGEIRDFFLTIGMIPGSTDSLASVIDITERKRAEKELAKSEERYRVLFEKSATANAILAEDTTILLANSNFETLFGYSREEMEGRMSWTALVMDEYLKRMKAYHAQRRTGDGSPPQSYEFKGIMRSGEIRDIFMSVAMIPGTKESMISLVDITELKQAEERFSSLVRNLPETVFETDMKGTITFVNEPSLARFGYTREELEQGLNFLDIIVPEDHQRGIENFAKVLKGELFGLVEYTARKKDGTRFPVLINTSVIVRAGQPAGVRGFLVDITDQKRAEHAILEERTFTDAVLDSVPGLLYLYDEEGHLHRWNKSHETLTGYSKEELGGMYIYDWFKHDEKDLASIKAGVEQAFREGHASAEGNLMTKSGTTIPYYFTARLLEIRGRRYITGIGIDISEQRKADQALRESEERWQFALEGAGDGVWDWDAQSNKVYFSPQWKAMLGYEDHEIGNVFSEWDSRLHPDDRDITYQELNRHLEGATPVYVSVHRLRCKNGEYRWILARGKVIHRAPDGKPIRVIGTHTDITERKANEERYSAIIQAALDGFIIFDMDGRIVEVNDAYSRMSGYNRDELTGMTIPDIDADLKPGEVAERIKNLDRVKSTRFETRHRRKDGTFIDVEVSIRVLEHETNRFFVFVRDITRQKNTAAALASSAHEKEALLLELQHRVKNSLAMITSLISLEMERPENDASRVILENLRGRIDSMASLYSLLIKSESATRVNLGDYIDAIITSLADTYLSGTSAITMKKQIDHIPTDAKSAAAWGLIANELLTNALKYAYPKNGTGVISVSLTKKKDIIELAVSDSGAGPPAGFDIENPKGFGTLLVKMLAGQLKGSFSFDRRKRGNVFSVRVPAPPGD